MRVIYTGSNREEWLRLRGEGLGASDAPIIMGLSKFCSPMMLYAKRLGIVEQGPPTGPMNRGRDCEVIIADKLQHDNDFMEAYPGALVFPDQRLVGSDEFEFMLATLDAVISYSGGKMLSEFKCPNYPYESGMMQEGVPDDIYAQCQHQMKVAETDKVLLAVLPALTWNIYWVIINRNDDFIETRLMPALKEFWQYIKDLVPPEVIGMKDETKAANALHKDSTGEVVSLHIDFLETVESWDQIDEDIKRLEKELERLKGTLRMAIGEGIGGILPNGRYISNKPNSKGQRKLTRQKEAVIVSMK